MFKIYLAGYIQGNKIEECAGWRKRIREHYDDWKGYGERYPINWLDPLNGKNFESITGDGLKSDTPPNAIIHRDYRSVTSSDLIIVNMDTFGESRPLTGTICELAWAWDKHIPIIMITTEDIYIKHPFLACFASVIVSSVDELLEKKFVNYFFKGDNSAIY